MYFLMNMPTASVRLAHAELIIAFGDTDKPGQETWWRVSSGLT